MRFMQAPMASATHLVNCPQCGADAPARDHVATECPQCTTLLVSLRGTVRRAAGFQGHLPREGDTVALVCRTCGGALPDEVLRAGAGARCTYCGERADLPPTILSMLRAMVTHPGGIPVAARNIARFWMTAAAAFVAVVLIYMFTPNTSLRTENSLPLSPATLVKEEGDARWYRLETRTESVTFRPRGSQRPSLGLEAYEFPPGPGVKRVNLLNQQHAQVLVTLVREKTGERLSRWISMYQGRDYSTDKKYYPDELLHASFHLDDHFRFRPLPPGSYHLEVTEMVLRGQGPPPTHFIAEWNGHYSDMNMWFIAAANILGWLFIMDLRRLARARLGEQSRWFGWTHVVAVFVLLMLLVESVHPLDPLGLKPGFNVREEPSKIPAGLEPPR